MQRNHERGGLFLCHGADDAVPAEIVHKKLYKRMLWRLDAQNFREWHNTTALMTIVSRMCVPIVGPNLVNGRNTRALQQACEEVARRITGSEWVALLMAVWIGVTGDVTYRFTNGYPHPDVKTSKVTGNRYTFFGFMLTAMGVRDDYNGGTDSNGEHFMRQAMCAALPTVEILNPMGFDGRMPESCRGAVNEGKNLPPTAAVNTRSWEDGGAAAFRTLRAQHAAITNGTSLDSATLSSKDLPTGLLFGQYPAQTLYIHLYMKCTCAAANGGTVCRCTVLQQHTRQHTPFDGMKCACTSQLNFDISENAQNSCSLERFL